MRICTKSLVEGAQKAKGIAVIIDVYRAFSLAPYLFHNGAKEIITVSEISEAFALKQKNPEYVLMGEEKGLKIDGFDFGNSPTEIEPVNFHGKTIIMRTSNGTKGILAAAEHADEILTGSFVNCGAIARYIIHKNPAVVTLVAMGNKEERRDEDELCAGFIRQLLEGGKPDFGAVKSKIKDYKATAKFFDESRPEFPERDFELCMQLDRFDFIVRAEKGRLVRLVKEDV